LPVLPILPILYGLKIDFLAKHLITFIYLFFSFSLAIIIKYGFNAFANLPVIFLKLFLEL